MNQQLGESIRVRALMDVGLLGIHDRNPRGELQRDEECCLVRTTITVLGVKEVWYLPAEGRRGGLTHKRLQLYLDNGYLSRIPTADM